MKNLRKVFCARQAEAEIFILSFDCGNFYAIKMIAEFNLGFFMKTRPAIILFSSLLLFAAAGDGGAAAMSTDNRSNPPSPARLETATFGAGCFWCVEAVFQNLQGVASVVSGYTGGTVDNPTYEQVCSGTTGHAEVCQIPLTRPG